MASAGSSLIKAVLVVLFVGVVFLALNFLLEEVPETETAPTAPGTSAEATTEPEVIEDPEVAEAREIGSRIGKRVGEEVGRRVGELLVAKLDAEGLPEGQAKPASGQSETATMDDGDAAEPATEMPMEADADDEEAETQVAAMDDTDMAEDKPETEEQPESAGQAPVTAGDEDEQAMTAQADQAGEEETMAGEEPASAGAGTQADKPARKTTTLPEPPEVNRWWNDSVNGNGLRIIYVGQSVTPDGKKGISVIFSDALAEDQGLNNLIQVSSSGESLDNNWRIAPHGKSIFYRVPGAGRYQMSFDPSLEDVNGKTLGIAVSGPVKIR